MNYIVEFISGKKAEVKAKSIESIFNHYGTKCIHSVYQHLWGNKDVNKPEVVDITTKKELSYKDFPKVAIGGSDGAVLIGVGGYSKPFEIHFGEDGDYMAYICYGNNVHIGEHYEKVGSAINWLKIYDDTGLSKAMHPWGYKLCDVYRAETFGCIIHWYN